MKRRNNDNKIKNQISKRVNLNHIPKPMTLLFNK